MACRIAQSLGNARPLIPALQVKRFRSEIDDQVPVIIPINIAMEKPSNGAPPSSHKAETVNSVVPEVIIVRLNVAAIAWLLISAVATFGFIRSNSRMRSAMMMESFNE